jgi:hypothetical protein
MPPAAIAIGVGAAALGAAAAGGASASDIGKVRYNGKNYKQTGNYDANKFAYGGHQDIANNMRAGASHRGGIYQGQQENLHGRGLNSLNDAQGARANMLGAAGRMDARAQGQNLISSRIANAARRNMGAQTQSHVASARGPAGLALAQQDAMAAGAQGSAAIADSEMTQGMNEQMMNERAAFEAHGNIRAGDVGQANTSFGAATQSGQLGLGYGQLENDVNKTQTMANIEEQKIAAQSHGQEQELLQDSHARNAQTDLGYFKAGLGAVGGGASTAAAGSSGGTSDPKAKTGTVKLGAKGASDDYWKRAGDKGGPYDPDGPYIPRNESPGERSTSGERYGGKSPYFKDYGNAIDLDAYAKEGFDVGEGPGERDFDADEYDAALFEKVQPRGREAGQTLRHSTDAETVRVLKSDADAMMAGMRANMARGPSVQHTSDLQAEALAQRAEQIRRAQEELDLAMHQGLMTSSVDPRRETFTPDLDPNRRDPLIRENPFGEERVAHASTPDTKFDVETFSKGFGDTGPLKKKTLGGGSGPSDGMTIGGGFHSGTNQLTPEGGLDTDFGTKWNNAELRGMARDPSGGMAASTPAAKGGMFKIGSAGGSSMSGGSSGLAAAAQKTSGTQKGMGELALEGTGDSLSKTADGLDTGGGYKPRQAGWSMNPTSDKHAKKEAFQLGVAAGAQKSSMPLPDALVNPSPKTLPKPTATMKPITLVGPSPDAKYNGLQKNVTGPRPGDDETLRWQNDYVMKSAELSHLPKKERDEQMLRHLQANEATRNREYEDYKSAVAFQKALNDKPVNLYGDPPVPDRTPITRKPDEDGMSSKYKPASDPKAKAAAEKLGGPHTNEVADTLDAVPAVSYKYKDPYFEPETSKPGQRQAGFLTTDLKKTPLGEAVVEERPDGYEGYNTHRMIGLQHAEIRNLHERMRELEEQLATARGGRHG